MMAAQMYGASAGQAWSSDSEAQCLVYTAEREKIRTSIDIGVTVELGMLATTTCSIPRDVMLSQSIDLIGHLDEPLHGPTLLNWGWQLKQKSKSDPSEKDKSVGFYTY